MQDLKNFRVNTPHVISETLEGEAIILNYETGSYYSLNETASRIWQLIEQKQPSETIAAWLAKQYEPKRPGMETSLAEFLSQLRTETLIVEDETGTPGSDLHSAAETGPAAERSAFIKPAFEKFSDMEDLLLLDPIHEVDDKGWPNVPEEKTEGAKV